MNTPTPADARQRAHLEARRAYLWRRSQILRNAGKDSLHLDHLALDAEEACYRINRAIMAIDDELDEGDDG